MIKVTVLVDRIRHTCPPQCSGPVETSDFIERKGNKNARFR